MNHQYPKFIQSLQIQEVITLNMLLNPHTSEKKSIEAEVIVDISGHYFIS